VPVATWRRGNGGGEAVTVSRQSSSGNGGGDCKEGKAEWSCWEWEVTMLAELETQGGSLAV
jgi:hypothetical protein